MNLKVTLCKFKRFKKTKNVSLEYYCSIFSDEELLREVGVTNAEGPPVPIPNTEVKLCSGENTWLEAAREDSSMPTRPRKRKLPRVEKESPK